jgi:PAS domain S-box-containing protein
MMEPGRSPALRYGVAVLSVAVVTLIRLLLRSLLGGSSAFLPYEVAVMVSAWYGGLRPGLLATALAASSQAYVFLPPVGSLSIADPSDQVQLALFVVIAVVISFVVDALKRELVERRRAEQASGAQTQALVGVIERLAHEHDLERLQGLVLEAIVNQLDAWGGELWLYNQETDAFRVVLVCQEGRVMTAEAASHPFAGQEITNRDLLAWEELKATYLRGECVQVADLQSDSRLSERMRAGLLQMGAQSFLMVPMLLQGRLVGLYIVRNSQPKRLGPREIQLAQAMAHQATLAMEFTRLAEQSRHAAVLQERERAAQERAAELEARVRERTAELETAKEALRHQAELMDISHDALIAWELGGGILSWNHGAEELYGWKRSDVLGKVTYDLLRSRHPVSVAALEAALARDGRWDGELLHTTRDGRQLVVESRHVVLQTEEGRRLVLEMNRDITARKQAEAALQASETRYRELAADLEHRVEERTAELARTVEALNTEVAEREQAERASRAQTRALTRVLEQLTQAQRFEAFPGIVLAAIVEQFAAAGGSLWLYDEVAELFEKVLVYEGGRVILADDPDQPFPQRRVDTRKIPDWDRVKAGYLRGESLVDTDFADSPAMEPSNRAAHAERGTRSILFGPMLLQGRLFGRYSLRSTRQENYGPRDLALAHALGHHATLAIQMARLAEQARQTAVLEERNRMAREIHDTLAQAFTGILLQLGAAERVMADAPEQGQAHLQTAGDLAREGLAEARRSVQALRPQALEEEDLAGALARMVEQLNSDPSTRIAFRRDGMPRPLPPDVADHLLRVGQEALTNALRHAQAREVGVELSFAGEELRLCVTDDGRGFAMEARPRKGGFGLTGMQERAGLIGAQLSVDSQPGSGTRVELTWRFPPG